MDMLFSVLAGIGVLLLAAVLLAVGMAPVLLIPILLVVGVVGAAFWLLSTTLRDAKVTSGPSPSGVPTTEQASYDPAHQR
jgi:Na+-transporting methylmalonyl-CoA/oxaloacetate decarboxylase gamma subunit